MKIRNQLTLLNTLIFAVILLAFAFSIYYLYAKSREEAYTKQLIQQATTKAHLLLDAKVDPSTLQVIYKNSRDTYSDEEVAIYNNYYELLYHDAVDIDLVKETEEMLKEIQENQTLAFSQDRWQVAGFIFTYNEEEFIITAAGYDAYGYQNLENLRNILFFAFFFGVVLTFFAGKLLSKQALMPMARVVKKVGEITATSLDTRVNEGNGKDEIAELAVTFNKMLDRLESSFNSQKEFVNNIAHELRTPLAAIIAELELSQSKPRSEAAYRVAIDRAMEDALKLSKLIAGLMDMAKAGFDQGEIKFRDIRLDELLLDARSEILRTSPQYKIEIAYSNDIQDDKPIRVNGNEYLLKNALANVMENGCKYSDDYRCQVKIDTKGENAVVYIKDQGIGIGPEDLPLIFNSFFRGFNKGDAEGVGIGLSLTKKVIFIHQGEISVESELEMGSLFKITLPKI